MVRVKYMGMLQQLNDEVTAMGALTQSAISNSVKILKTGNVSLIEEALGYEEEINEKEKAIETLCMKLILHQHPMAEDLRFVSSVMKIVTDMERIGDNALDIAKISQKLYGKGFVFEPNGIMKMAEETIKMVGDSISAYIAKDMEKLDTVIENDDVVDDLFDKFMDDSSENLAKKQKNIFDQMELLLIAKYFEKIGDHAVTIAEWGKFVITGEKN